MDIVLITSLIGVPILHGRKFSIVGTEKRREKVVVLRELQ
jgi:hypothetical protein